MIIEDIKSIPSFEVLGIIINVGTKEFTTQAIASFRVETDMPLCVIDCSLPEKLSHNKRISTDYEYLIRLNEKYDFYLLKLPLQEHGLTLDYLFRNTTSKNLLLMDSDVELLNQGIIKKMIRYINKQDFMGSGFISPPCELTKESIGRQNFGLYQERMFIPLVVLNVASIKIAFYEGKKSFLARMEYNDFPLIPKVSEFLFQRFRKRELINLRLRCLNPFKKEYFGDKPCCIYNDTGAEIWMYLKYKKRMQFYGPPTTVYPDYFTHFHGATRKKLIPQDPNTGKEDMSKLLNNLLGTYNIDVRKYS